MNLLGRIFPAEYGNQMVIKMRWHCSTYAMQGYVTFLGRRIKELASRKSALGRKAQYSERIAGKVGVP
jgi:hypothetical protein